MVVDDLRELFFVAIVADAVHDQREEEHGGEADAQDPGVVENVHSQHRRHDDHQRDDEEANQGKVRYKFGVGEVVEVVDEHLNQRTCSGDHEIASGFFDFEGMAGPLGRCQEDPLPEGGSTLH